jgi:hypothetical protein
MTSVRWPNKRLRTAIVPTSFLGNPPATNAVQIPTKKSGPAIANNFSTEPHALNSSLVRTKWIVVQLQLSVMRDDSSLSQSILATSSLSSFNPLEEPASGYLAASTKRGQPLCGNSEGWGPLSPVRYDFTPCFMDVWVSSVALFGILFGAGAVWWLLNRKKAQEVSKDWHFWTKQVWSSYSIPWHPQLKRKAVCQHGCHLSCNVVPLTQSAC